MSKKKHKKHHQFNAPSTTAAPVAAQSPQPLSHSGEYRVIRHDLWRVVILNILYLAAILVLYYTNKNTGYLDRTLEQWFHF